MATKPHMTFVAIALISVCATLSGQPNRPFVVAAYSFGGLEPFARFTGARWVNTWPAPDESDVKLPSLAEIPSTWLGKRVPLHWTFWPSTGERRNVTVIGIRRGRGDGGGCAQPAVLTIDQNFGDETAGLAVDSDQVVEPIGRVLPSSAEWQRLEPVISSAVAANERRVVEAHAINPSWQREALAKVDVFKSPLTIESLYRPQSDASPMIYYFEATRRATRGNEVLLSMKVSGWVRSGPKGASAFALFGTVFEDEGMWTMTPMAVFRVGGRVYWITAMSHYESGEFVIRDVSPTAVRDVLTSGGGGC